jgi:hypothetical protein
VIYLSHTLRQINLASTIASLVQHVDECRIAFCDLQDASANVKKSRSLQFRQSLDDIRAQIIEMWRGLPSYLHQIISFGDEFDLCPPGGDPKALDDFQNVSWTLTVKAMNMAQELSNANSTSQRILNHHKASITKLLPSDLPSTQRTRDSLLIFPGSRHSSNAICK